MNKPDALLTKKKCYHRVITTNVCVKRRSKQLEVILNKYTGDQGRVEECKFFLLPHYYVCAYNISDYFIMN